MKKIFSLVFLFGTLLVSCNEDEAPLLESKTYYGIFFRTVDGVSMDTSNVTLKIDGNAFEGSSSVSTYPAIGFGTYEIGENSITFYNESFWLAYFDWTYILKETFILERENGLLFFRKAIGTTIVDTYIFNESNVE